MIYISSSCIRAKTIKKTVIKLKDNGFSNIELSGGTEYYDGIEDDLLELKNKYDLHFLLHNYFPPPKKNFVINLASLDDLICIRSMAGLKNSLDLCRRLGVKKFSFHAGFFMDIHVAELNRGIPKRRLYDRKAALAGFCARFVKLKEYAPDIKLYIENNVYSSLTRRRYSTINPFMLTNYSDYLTLKKMINFGLLIDVAHLYVSCSSLGLNFSEQLNALMPYADYLHLSDVDSNGQHHRLFAVGSHLLKSLKGFNLAKKTITLEINGSIDDLKRSYSMVRNILL